MPILSSNAITMIQFQGWLREIKNKCGAFDAPPLKDLSPLSVFLLLSAPLALDSFLAALEVGNSHSSHPTRSNKATPKHTCSHKQVHKDFLSSQAVRRTVQTNRITMETNSFYPLSGFE